MRAEDIAHRKSYSHSDTQGKTIITLFNDQVKRNPNGIALTFQDKNITYSELSRYANSLAAKLLAKGVGRDMLVPLCFERSFEMIVAILGVLIAGAAYVPLDPLFPDERLMFMLEEINAPFLVLSSSIAARFRNRSSIQIFIAEINVDDDEQIHSFINESDLAYAIYTSGSTGKPKAALLEHRGLINYIIHQSAEFRINRNDVILQTSNYAFDPSVEQIFLALCNGARLVLIDKNVLSDPDSLEKILNEEKITHLHATPSLLQLITPGNYFLKRVVSGGESCLPSLAASWNTYAAFYNKYGPTEATISSTLFRYTEKYSSENFVPIGEPVSNTEIYILDENGNQSEVNAEGELYIGGIGVARGYLNRPELTKEKFVHDPFADEPLARMYRTGDIARWLPDGNIEFVRRKDDQVKINGHRIECGEIENTLAQFSSIQQAVVVAFEEDANDTRLAAYIISSKEENIAEIKKYLAAKLPEYMVPAYIIQLPELPLTSNGKTDKKALPSPVMKRPALDVLYAAPQTETERKLAQIWKSVLKIDKVGILDNFFEIGGSSLLAVKAISVFNKQSDQHVPVTHIYQYLNIQAIASAIDNKNTKSRKVNSSTPSIGNHDHDIAVIGMAGRFPGANSVDELWQLLRQGKESIHFFNDDEIDPSIPDRIKNDPLYVKARGVLEKTGEFDPLFFGINPKLAQLMDPQHRVFLEIAYEALESSGYATNHHDKRVGVFAGCRNNMYYYTNVLHHAELVERVGAFQVMTANEKDYLATRTAFSLDLKGPAVNVQSACSTSLLAIAQAVQSIRSGQCDMALAGAAAIALPVKSGYLYQEGAMLSNDGHCRPFDADAKGTVFCDGAGVVLLKSRKQAEKDGDIIYAFIKGVGVNNDGGVKGSFTAPSVSGQAGAIAMALSDADVDPSTISYVEAHGTATPLGDPIEIEALQHAYGAQEKKQYCAIGSVKSNLGHLTVASGAAGFIKTVLSLYYKKLVPTLFYTSSNPNIDFTKSSFYVNTDYKDWATDGVRRAGVSAFGVGGTNVHVILEENNESPGASRHPLLHRGTMPAFDTDERPQLICWSAKNEASRDKYSEKLNDYLQRESGVNIADLAYTFHLHRQSLNARRFVVADNRNNLIQVLGSSGGNSKLLSSKPSGVVFIFPGQGSQHVNMGKELYQTEEVFRDAMDECFLLLKEELKEDLKEIIYPATADEAAEKKLRNTRYAQPALFVIEYATAKLWMSKGIQPDALIGHSIGEFVAAHLSGVFDLKDALKLVAARGRLMSELPAGNMLSVRLSVESIKAILPEDLSIAAVNAPGLCVVSGASESINEFSARLDERNIANSILHTSHAFHSLMMQPAVAPFKNIVDTIQLNKPAIPIISTASGKLLTDSEALCSGYWSDHLRKTVRFSDAVEYALKNTDHIFLEAGPMNVCTTLVRQHAKAVAVNSFESKSKSRSEYESILHAMGNLWLNGIEPDWNVLYEKQERNRINDLPTYAFDKKYYWVDPPLQNNISPLEKLIARDEYESIASAPVAKSDSLTDRIKKILSQASGLELDAVNTDTSFIEMGLDSLSLTQIAITLKNEFNLPITFRKLNETYFNLGLLSSYIGSSVEEKTPEKVVAEVNVSVSADKAVTVPALESQVEIFAACLLGGDAANCSYNQSVHLDLEGNYDHAGMMTALQDLVARHEVLRATFSADGKDLFIAPELPVPVSFIDLSSKTENEQTAEIEDNYQQYTHTPFDLLNGPLFKVVIFKLSDRRHYLSLMAHHIICDGWSFSILMEDLGLLYNARLAGKLPQLAEAKSFTLFSAAQQEFYQSKEYQQNGKYWKDVYKKDIPVLSVPTDYYRPPMRTYNAKRSVFKMNSATLEEIKKTGAENGCSFVTTLLTAFQFYIHHISGQNNIIIGLPVAGQPATGYYRLVGHCVNLLPIRSDIDPSVSFIDYLKQQRTNILDAFDHQLYTYGSILKQLPFHRDPSRIPLVPIVFNFDTGMDNKVDFQGLQHTRISKPRAFENFEIFLNLNDSNHSVDLEWSFNSNLFNPDSIKAMMTEFEDVLQVISEDYLVSLGILSSKLIKKTIVELNVWNKTTVDYPKEKAFHDLFSDQVKITPDFAAIKAGDKNISYEHLEKTSNQLAALLISKGVNAGDIIALAADRTPDLLTALLGISKSGAAYLPLDPNYPKDRVDFMLQDSGAKILLTSKKYSGQFDAAQELLIENVIAELEKYPNKNPEVNITGSDLAYILYTSGSTGKPKGVEIEHHNLVNFLCSMKKDIAVQEKDLLLAVTTISFDISGLELFLPLVSGAAVIIGDADIVKDGRLLLELIKRDKPTILQATPSAWQMLLESGLDKNTGLKTICCGGEALGKDLALKLFNCCDNLYNLYGPTETTIWSTAKKITNPNEIITVGRPIDNTKVVVLDEKLEPVAKNIRGEIYIAGEGVARGYHNRPDLTEERFVKDPRTGIRMYKTGDIGKFVSNGEIMCLGRADHQVKIRGHRIELGEIEHAIASNKLVKQVVVVARAFSENDHRLVAYIVTHEAAEESKLTKELKEGIVKRLPAWMVPNHYVMLDALPVTPNGKTDRNALPAPVATQKEHIPDTPQTKEEKLVAKIWSEVLNIEEIGVDDDFFELGGHSMIAVQMMTKLEKETGIHLPLATLFEQSTIRKFALFIKKEDKASAFNCLVTIKGTGSKMPLYMIHGIGGSAPFVNTKIKDFDPEQPIYGIQARGLNGNGEIVGTIEEMASLYIKDILEQNPDGPYALAGYSFGGFVAYEMAQQLRALGKEVKMLGILDTYSGLAYRGDSKGGQVFRRIYHRFRKAMFSTGSFFRNPLEKIAFEYDEIQKQARIVYYAVSRLMGKKRTNWFYYKNQIAKNNYIALKRYRLKPYEGTICLFRSMNKTYYLPDFEYLGWKEMADVKIFEIPGEHNTIFSPQNETGVVKVLQSCLDSMSASAE